MAQRLDPAARDAAARRVTLITTGVVALGLASTVGLGMAIAAEQPASTATPDPVVEEPAETPPLAQVPAANNKPAAQVPPTKSPQTPQTGGKATQPKPTAPAAPKPKPTKKPPVTSSGGS